MSSLVREQYERYPYPSAPLLGRYHADQLWQINVPWLLGRCGVGVRKNPSIWIAGCGTSQPYLFGLANPESSILASDLSQTSLNIAQRRTRGMAKRIRFQHFDLSDANSYPEGPFDYIECYGVLMCLENPLEALVEMAKRLKPEGVMRVMVYPYYGRQRIFQIQRLARLLKLRFQDPKAPQRLAELMQSLPNNHVLKRAFDTYADAATDAGIVDGFLHASDRGFSGVEFSDLLDRAGLELAMCMHRPWGQPREMAEKLGLLAHDPALWLHYLDLWQELRSNFILCLVKKGVTQTERVDKFHHPLFSQETKGLGVRYRTRLARLAFTGGKFQTRTHDDRLRLGPKAFRALVRGRAISPAASEMLLENLPPRIGGFFRSTPRTIRPNLHFRIRSGSRTLNPLYDYLWDAYTFGDQWRLGMPTLESELKQWEKIGNPLEDDEIPFGLTPLGTYQYEKSTHLDWVKDCGLNTGVPVGEFPLDGETKKIEDLYRRFKNFIPRDLSRPQERELLILLGSQGLFL